MKVCILGGGGFLGSHISEAFLSSGNDVTIFDLETAEYLDISRNRKAKIVTGEFSNIDNLGDIVQNNDVIINLVYTTLPKISNQNPQYDIQTNVISFINLLDLLREMPGKKVIYPSSGGTIYGIPKEVPIKETHPKNPICSYGITKLTNEKYLHLYWTLYDVNYCILRIGNAYGERQPTNGEQGLIGAFLDKAIQNEEITVWGDGSAIRDYVYVGDVARAFVQAASYKDEPRILNIGSGKGHSINDITETIRTILKVPLKINYLPSRCFDVPSNVLDISMAKTYLGWEPRIGLQEGITRAFRSMG